MRTLSTNQFFNLLDLNAHQSWTLDVITFFFSYEKVLGEVQEAKEKLSKLEEKAKKQVSAVVTYSTAQKERLRLCGHQTMFDGGWSPSISRLSRA